jgi:signal transduction histidine kinase
MFDLLRNSLSHLIPAKFFEEQTSLIESLKNRYLIYVVFTAAIIALPFSIYITFKIDNYTSLITGSILLVMILSSSFFIYIRPSIVLTRFIVIMCLELIILNILYNNTVPLYYPKVLFWTFTLELTVMIFLGWVKSIPLFIINMGGIYYFFQQHYQQLALSGTAHENQVSTMVGTIVLFHLILCVIGYYLEKTTYLATKSYSALTKKELDDSYLKEVSKILQTLSHEINNPLSIILGSSRVIKNQVAAKEPIDKNLIKMIEQVDHAASRINGVINKFKVYSDEHQTNISEAKIVDIIYDINFFYRNKMKMKNINFDINISPEIASNTGVAVSKRKIEQILFSLIDNAYEEVSSMFTPSIKINIFFSEDYKQIVFEVVDNGQGVDSLLIERIFEPFFTTKNLATHSGLGLSTAQSIAKEIETSILYKREQQLTHFQFSLKV